MKRTIRHTMFGKKIRKGMLVGVISCMILGNLLGCRFTYRTEQLEKEMKSEDENAKELITTLFEALEAEDVEAIKEMFSPYALEHAENLDEKIEELIEFYPGSNGGYKMNVPSRRGSDYGVIEHVITPIYEVVNDDKIYEVRITAYIENDVDADKLGVYSIQVMTEEAAPEGFKWRNEDDEPGVYVLE